ncbi:MAG TPA: cytochrome c oxidase subunit 3 [Pyrinomonadaceae bacterium]|nr:cytochrome c oxidase subunit 3 [Pyrinomonadaceae bacterium]
MVTTVTGTRERTAEGKKGIDLGGKRPRGGNGSRGPNGKGPGGAGGDGGGQEWSPERYRIGLLVGLASILMMFTALVSAYIVRSGLPTSTDWRPIAMPRVLILSTALIIVSSLTAHLAVRAVRSGDEGAQRRWLAATLVLGLGFLGSQLFAWRGLAAQGVFLASNPHSSFFYLLTGLHGVHLLGGILALAYVLARALMRDERPHGAARRRATVEAAARYWHFMDALWVFLFLLLFVWR